jgi:hypothetical protein
MHKGIQPEAISEPVATNPNQAEVAKQKNHKSEHE